jgi:hypothetical protein
MEDLTITPDQPRPKKRPVGLLILFAVGGIAAMSVMVYFSQKSTFVDYNYTLLMTAKAMNVACPQQVDQITRLDSVTAKRDKIFTYHYTFFVNTAELDSAYCDRWRENVRANAKGHKDLEEFGKNGVTLVYKSHDENGNDLCELVLPPTDYYMVSR